MSANDRQVGGTHYAAKPVQPWDYIAANGLGYFEGNVVKYVSRWRDKGGVADLEKAAHYLQKLIELQKPAAQTPEASFHLPATTRACLPGGWPLLGDEVIDAGGHRGLVTEFGLGAPEDGHVWVQYKSGAVLLQAIRTLRPSSP